MYHIDGIFFEGLVYVSGYLFLLFLAICLACGLYFMAELAEEYPSLTAALIKYYTIVVLVTHPLLCVFESFPVTPVLCGFAAHCCYFKMLDTFPFTEWTSPALLCSIAGLVLSNYLWWCFFTETYLTAAHIMGFFFTCVWCVPFIFFISLTINENVLPSAGFHPEEAHKQASGGAKKGVLLTVFDFIRRKKEDAIVEHAPPSWHMTGKDC
eukprot:TRINITY_DN1381_c0_g1_i2.p2 TRINITY_DN1381_c0_g1~~TRINITY_DN1381_c0_g1_i2.p2  ORF type:complete len:210 (+),score=62.19 TRINITY_DN1381_c0_g1_i2:138-767(+)